LGDGGLSEVILGGEGGGLNEADLGGGGENQAYLGGEDEAELGLGGEDEPLLGGGVRPVKFK